MTAYAAAVHRLTNHSDFGVGTLIAVRCSAAHAEAVSCLLETHCLRFAIAEGQSGRELLAMTARVVAEARRTQCVPFHEVVQGVQVIWDGRHPLFQTLFVPQDNDPAVLDFDGTRATQVAARPVEPLFEIVTEVWPEVDGGANSSWDTSRSRSTQASPESSWIPSLRSC